MAARLGAMWEFVVRNESGAWLTDASMADLPVGCTSEDVAVSMMEVHPRAARVDVYVPSYISDRSLYARTYYAPCLVSTPDGLALHAPSVYLDMHTGDVPLYGPNSGARRVTSGSGA